MIIDCHVHAGELNKHYPIWWIEELYRVGRGASMDLQWTYDRPTMSVGERLVYQMDQLLGVGSVSSWRDNTSSANPETSRDSSASAIIIC